MIEFDDLAPVEVPVKVKGAMRFVLVEASAEAAVRYRSACAKSFKYDDGKIVGAEGLAAAEPLLVSLCLYHSTEESAPKLPNGDLDNSKRVDLKTVLSWPSHVQKQMFDRIMEISPGLRLNEAPKAPASSGEGTSS